MTDQGERSDKPSGEESLRAKAKASEDIDEKVIAAGDLSNEYGEYSPRYVTPNQVIAYNMAFFRKAAGLTQEELGRRLAGWTAKPWPKAAVSAVERSWDGKTRRQFDADLLFGLSAALGVPIPAFFLPPDIEGIRDHYMLLSPHAPEGGRGDTWSAWARTMKDYAGHVLSEPYDDDGSPATAAYRSRLASMVSIYFGAELLPPSYFDDLTTEEQIGQQLVRLRQYDRALLDLAGELKKSIEHLDDRLDEIRDKDDKANPELSKIRTEERERRSEENFAALKGAILSLHRMGRSTEEISKAVRLRPNFVEHYLQEALDEEAGGDEGA